MKVFLSYSRVDKAFVGGLQTELAALGYDVWTDVEDMDKMSEDDWRDAVVNAISVTDVMVLVLSPDSTTSTNVKQEMSVAADAGKRIVPILHRKCELHGAFKLLLLNKHYIDFVEYGPDEGLRRLTTRLGAPGEAATKNDHVGPASEADSDASVVSDEYPAGGDEATTHGQDDGSASHDSDTETNQGDDHGRNEDGDGRRTIALVAGGVGLLVVVVLAIVLTSGSDPPSEREQAEDLVTTWADATTERDFEEAARIDPSHSPEFLETLYRSADDPVRMISVQPYIAETAGGGSLWRFEGAAMALDYNEEPTIRTHVMCSNWVVDLDAGTATWTTGAGQFFEGEQISSERFEEVYEAVCT
jgi:hypothetical protein